MSLRKKVFSGLTTEPATIKEIAARIGMSSNKNTVGAILAQLTLGKNPRARRAGKTSKAVCSIQNRRASILEVTSHACHSNYAEAFENATKMPSDKKNFTSTNLARYNFLVGAI